MTVTHAHAQVSPRTTVPAYKWQEIQEVHRPTTIYSPINDHTASYTLLCVNGDSATISFQDGKIWPKSVNASQTQLRVQGEHANEHTDLAWLGSDNPYIVSYLWPTLAARTHWWCFINFFMRHTMVHVAYQQCLIHNMTESQTQAQPCWCTFHFQ